MKKRSKILLFSVLVASCFVFGIVKYGQRGLPVYDALDFLGAGQGDTVSAINLAIQTASAGGAAGVVYIPEGNIGVRTSYLSGTAYRPVGIIGASNVTLRGAGAAKTRIIQDAPPIGATFDTTSLVTNSHFSSIVRCTNCSNFIIEDLTINGTLSRQINHTGNPYTNPQDGLGNDSLQTDGIYFIGGKHNIIRNVHLDSVQGYGFRISNCYQATIDGTISSNAINGGVYFVGQCNGSVLQNSLVTNNNCDNVRIRSQNITIINNEISWSKFNPAPGGASFAGIYVENNPPPNISTTGINIIGNRIHDNSTYPVDAFNTDTTNWTLLGPTVSIRGNEMYHNANGGVQCQMQWMTVDGNDIFDNGADSLGRQDPVTYSPNGVIVHGLASNGLSITNNKFRNSLLGVGKQLYGITMASPTGVPIFDAHGNTQFGGLDLMLTSTAGLNANGLNVYYGNTIIDSNKLSRSPWTTNPDGSITMYNYTPGLGGTASGAIYLSGTNDAQLIGIHAASATRAFYIGDFYPGSGAGVGFKIGEYGTGSAGLPQRTLGFYDFPSGVNRGIVNSVGDLVWGTIYTGTNWSFAVHNPANDLSVSSFPGAVELQVPTSGSVAGKQWVGYKTTMLAGYTGSGGLVAGTWIDNQVAGSGTQVNFGATIRATGANTGAGSVNEGVQGFASGGLVNIGAVGYCAGSQLNNASAQSIGMIGYGLRANASAVEIGVAAVLSASNPTFTSAALFVDNTTEAVPVALFRSNGTTAVQVDANGNLSVSLGKAFLMPEGSNGRVGQVALIAGTKAITITGLTTSSRAFISLVSPNTSSSTIIYQGVCTSNTLTIQANIAAGTINASDVSTVNYFVINSINDWIALAICLGLIRPFFRRKSFHESVYRHAA